MSRIFSWERISIKGLENRFKNLQIWSYEKKFFPGITWKPFSLFFPLECRFLHSRNLFSFHSKSQTRNTLKYGKIEYETHDILKCNIQSSLNNVCCSRFNLSFYGLTGASTIIFPGGLFNTASIEEFQASSELNQRAIWNKIQCSLPADLLSYLESKK